MFTPGKIILTIILVIIGWYAFKFFRRVNDIAKLAKTMVEKQKEERFYRTEGREAVEMKACDVCGSYSSNRCDRKDCPF